MASPSELKYSKEHEWVKLEGNIATMGISDFAQRSLTDIVFVELPEIGKEITAHESLGAIESVKSVSDIFCPVSGKVIEINTLLVDDPSILNNDPYGQGWLIKIELTNPSELDALMDNTAYDELTSKEG